MSDPKAPYTPRNSIKPFSVGDFSVDPGANRITGPNTDRTIEPKAMQVLCALAERPGETVRREELLENVWAGRVVVDETLTRAVSLLRQVLNDGSSKSGYIQTVPKQGYRLTASVTEIAPSNTADHPDAPRLPTEHSRLKQWSLVGSVAAMLLTMLVFLGLQMSDPDPDPSAITSVAVLPFEQLDDSPETAYLAAGVAEELTSVLASVPGLRVPSRHSSEAISNERETLKDIAAALGVGHVLEGSVRRGGPTLRISARLVHADTDTTIWSRQYDGEMERIFAVQEEIASAVVQALQGTNRSSDAAQSGFTRSSNLDAYSLYLQGQYWWMNGNTGDWFYRARDAFEQATALDPNFAEAHASLAFIYARHRYHDQYMSSALARRKASDAIERALAIDAGTVDAYLARALLATATSDFEGAADAIQSALSIEPDNPVAHYIDSELQLARNAPEQALVSAERALSLDPLSPWVNVNKGIVHYYRGEYSSATQAINEAIRIDPKYTWAFFWKAMVQHAQGELADAVRSMRRCIALDPGSETNAAFMGLLYLDLMDEEQAQHWFEQAASLQGDDNGSRVWDRMVGLAYERNDDPLLLELALRAMPALHNSRFTLVPVIAGALAATGRSAESEQWFNPIWSGTNIQIDPIQPHDASIALALAAEPLNDQLRKAFAEGSEAFPSYYRHRGWIAHWHMLRAQPSEALRSLNTALDQGWLIHWWQLRGIPALQPLIQTTDFRALLQRIEEHAKSEAAKLAAIDTPR